MARQVRKGQPVRPVRQVRQVRPVRRVLRGLQRLLTSRCSTPTAHSPSRQARCGTMYFVLARVAAVAVAEKAQRAQSGVVEAVVVAVAGLVHLSSRPNLAGMAQRSLLL